MAERLSSTGRAKVALVVSAGAQDAAVISTVVVRTVDRSGGPRVLFAGPVRFHPTTEEHIRSTVLSVVDRILEALRLPRPQFEIAVANLGATAVQELGITVSGYSADVPVFLAMLAASLQLPVADDLVSTGHLASSDGDIACVSGIPAKVAAAVAGDSIVHFVCPGYRRDRSLQTLTPAERDRMEAAIIDARAHIGVTSVNDVAELIRHVFREDRIVLASLESGFFGLSFESAFPTDAVGRAVRHLALGNEERFWSSLHADLLSGQSKATCERLAAWSRHHVGRSAYPTHFGARLNQLVRSLPPAIRRQRAMFPLLPMNECIALGRFAREDDHDDVRMLIAAANGAVASSRPETITGNEPDPATDCGDANAAVETVLNRLGATHLAQTIGLPIDTARGRFTLDATTVTTDQEFREIVTAFYVHVLRHTGMISGSVGHDAAAAKALKSVGEAFARKGGYASALIEARDGTQGGLRFVLDAMTDSLKNEQQEAYVYLVLRQAVEGTSWDEQVAFVAALLHRLGPHLPEDVRNAPPENFAKSWDLIARVYVKSLEPVQSLLRNM